MKITEINRHVTLRLEFTEDEAQELVRASVSHYSPECRPGLFIPIQRLTELLGRNIRPLDYAFNWRELDILSKICESPLVGSTLSAEVWKAFKQLRELTEHREIA